jgi:anti-sigma regulatory factor (Ser/Thr protein kinase)
MIKRKIQKLTVKSSLKKKQNIEISDEVPKYVKTDLTRFSQILINLISNSLKFTKKGVVSIKLQLLNENNNQKIQIQIEDNGIGIPEEYLDKIFEKFVQVDVKLNEQYKGTGLGLSIVKRLVDLFNGEISVKSKINVGTVFTVKIPYIKADSEIVFKQNTVLAAKKNKAHFKILIVEDNKINQMVTKKLLDKSEHSCRIAENGLEAIELVVIPNSLIFLEASKPFKTGI